MASGTTRMGRRQAEALMESTCVITRTATGDIDPTTGLPTATATPIYSGKCRLRFPFVRPEQAVAEGQTLAKDRGILSLPVVGDSSLVRADDMVLITLGPLDPGTIITARVQTPFMQTHATARRFPVEVLY